MRPLTATKSFSHSPFPSSTFKPFTIGKSTTPDSENSAHATPTLPEPATDKKPKEIIKAKPKKKVYGRNTPRTPLPLPYRPTTASKMSNRAPSAHLLHSPSPPPKKEGRVTGSALLLDKKHDKESKDERFPALKLKSDHSTHHTNESVVATHDHDTVSIGSSEAIWDKYKRAKVPHDYHLNRYKHTHFCTEFPFKSIQKTGHPATLQTSMVTKNLSYSSRHIRTTFGKSNRIDFLRDVFARSGPSSLRPMYPATYHGTGGEGKENALGLSMAGSAGDERILRTVYTYGETTSIPNRSYPPSKLPVDINVPEIVSKVTVQPDPAAPKHIRDVIHIQGGQWHPLHIQHATTQKSLDLSTRYSANKEWGRKTKVTVQSFPESHYYLSEPARFAHAPFVDEDKPKQQAAYSSKIRNLVRDKNINTVHELLNLAHLV